MKKLILILSIITLFSSCTDSKVKDVAAFEFDNAWYWVASYSQDATEQDRKKYMNLLTTSNKTSYFFMYPDSVDVSLFKQERFDLKTFAATVTNDPKPTYGFYKMAGVDKLEEDALWLLEQINK